ncbi:MAG: M3 family oligoendopeptidase [Solobacterium sp.]|nr:M3 family oligoendopeptidase [Solobacterium sp.]
MKFADIPYTRLNLEEINAQYDALIFAMKEADGYAAVKDAFVRKDRYERHLSTMRSLASIRNSIDTRDPFYDREMQYWHHAAPAIAAREKEWAMALLASPWVDDLADEYGPVFLENLRIKARTYHPKNETRMRQENLLVKKYQDLIASARIPFHDSFFSMAQLSPYKNDPDDAVRKEAWIAEGTWLKQNQKELDDIYDSLVHLRHDMAVEMGYENFLPLGYDRMTRNCYGRREVEAFREAVRRYIVPLAYEIQKAQSKRTGFELPMLHCDNQLEFRDGNPRPSGDVVEAAADFYHALSPKTDAFFKDMRAGEFYDLPSRDGKRAGGYCTSVADYRMPFIFACLNGTQHDVEVMTHEAGHAFAAYVNRDRVPLSTVWPTLEACECHSMSMEFFSELYAERFFGKDTDKYRFSHLAGAIRFLPYGTMVDHFQHIVYDSPNLTPSERDQVWRDLTAVYQPWLKLDGTIPMYGEGMAWQRQHHIYTRPFYYIDYCLAQTISLVFWSLIRKDRDAAWDKYMKFTEQGGSMTFTELLKHAELPSPFDEKTLAAAAAEAAEALKEFEGK